MIFIQGRNRNMTLALKMFQVTFSLNFPASLVASTWACQIKPRALISTLWVHTGWPGHVQMREERREREGEQQLKNRVLFPPSCPLRAKSLRKLFFFLVSSATATCLSISTSFPKPPTETTANSQSSVEPPKAVIHLFKYTHTLNKDKVVRSKSQTSFKQI